MVGACLAAGGGSFLAPRATGSVADGSQSFGASFLAPSVTPRCRQASNVVERVGGGGPGGRRSRRGRRGRIGAEPQRQWCVGGWVWGVRSGAARRSTDAEAGPGASADRTRNHADRTARRT